MVRNSLRGVLNYRIFNQQKFYQKNQNKKIVQFDIGIKLDTYLLTSLFRFNTIVVVAAAAWFQFNFW